MLVGAVGGFLVSGGRSRRRFFFLDWFCSCVDGYRCFMGFL